MLSILLGERKSTIMAGNYVLILMAVKTKANANVHESHPTEKELSSSFERGRKTLFCWFNKSVFVGLGTDSDAFYSKTCSKIVQ